MSSLGRVQVGNIAYLVHGRIACGKRSEVFLARRDTPLTEMVILKVGEVAAEWDVLGRLRRHAQGTFLGALLPEPVQCVGRTSVWRWRSDFMHNLEDARLAYPKGIPNEAGAWLGNRLLEQLTQLHGLGYRHGALQLSHMLVPPRAHAMVMCGWSECGRGAEDASAGLRALASLLARGPLQKWFLSASGSAAVLKEELKRVSLATLGPPKFCPLSQIERR